MKNPLVNYPACATSNRITAVRQPLRTGCDTRSKMALSLPCSALPMDTCTR